MIRVASIDSNIRASFSRLNSARWVTVLPADVLLRWPAGIGASRRPNSRDEKGPEFEGYSELRPLARRLVLKLCRRRTPVYKRRSALEGSIHLRLEGREHVDHRGVEEREHLREEHAADALRPVDPEVGVGETRPGQAAGGAAGRQRLSVDQEAQAPLLGDAREKLDVLGQPRDG